jgi:hypothetical protein
MVRRTHPTLAGEMLLEHLVAGRSASGHAFPRGAWEREKFHLGAAEGARGNEKKKPLDWGLSMFRELVVVFGWWATKRRCPPYPAILQ